MTFFLVKEIFFRSIYFWIKVMLLPFEMLIRVSLDLFSNDSFSLHFRLNGAEKFWIVMFVKVKSYFAKLFSFLQCNNDARHLYGTL